MNYKLSDVNDKIGTLVGELSNESSVPRVESGFRLLALFLSFMPEASDNDNAEVRAVFDALVEHGDGVSVATSDARANFRDRLDAAINFRKNSDRHMELLPKAEQVIAEEEAFRVLNEDISALHSSEILFAMTRLITTMSDIAPSECLRKGLSAFQQYLEAV